MGNATAVNIYSVQSGTLAVTAFKIMGTRISMDWIPLKDYWTQPIKKGFTSMYSYSFFLFEFHLIH